MRVRVEGYIPIMKSIDPPIIHTDHDLYYVFDSLRYGPIHEEGEMKREDMIREFQNINPQFHEEYCHIIKVGDERDI